MRTPPAILPSDAPPFHAHRGEELTDEEFVSAGGNISLNHLDFMIGSPQMDIDGLKEDGTREPARTLRSRDNSRAFFVNTDIIPFLEAP